MNRSRALDDHTLLDVGFLWRREGELFMKENDDVGAGSLASLDAEGLPSRSLIRPGFVASGRMMAAYDCARALGVLWGQGEVHHVADYALLRVMFEGAGSAWWITSGTSREERITRAFRVVLDELEQAAIREKKAIKRLPPGRAQEVRSRALEGIKDLTNAVRDDLSNAGVPAREEARISLSAILNTADNAVKGDYAFATAWSMMSSVAHGSLTSVLQLADRSQHPSMIMSNAESVLSFTDPAGALLTLARQSWDRYAREPV